MKKSFRLAGLLLMAVTFFGFVACGNDGDEDDNDGIDTSPISLIAGKEKVIQGADTINSSNKFVAYGSKNTVYAWHVGEANLLVNGKKSISITVLPQYHLYNDPVCEWGCSQDNVKNKQTQGTLSSKSTSESLIYEDAGAASLMIYQFKNGKLTNVGALVSTNYTSQYASFLAERYLMLPYYKGEDTYFVGVDALELEKGNTVAALSVYSAKYLMTIYMPVSEFTRATRSQNDIDIFRKDIIANINKFFVDEELLN